MAGKSASRMGSRFPEGSDYYNFLLRTHTTTDLSAEEIHQLGLDEVENCEIFARGIVTLGLLDEPGLSSGA